MKLGFCDRFSKNIQIPNFMKIRPVGAELFHADRRTDGRRGRQTGMTKLMVAFYNFARASNKGLDKKKKAYSSFTESWLADSIQNIVKNSWALQWTVLSPNTYFRITSFCFFCIWWSELIQNWKYIFIIFNIGFEIDTWNMKLLQWRGTSSYWFFNLHNNIFLLFSYVNITTIIMYDILGQVSICIV